MHDIICPKCGKKYLGRNCTFDLSRYITAMLCTDDDNQEDVRKTGFRFVVDEDEIIASNPDENPSKIISKTLMGPSSIEDCFSFPVTYDYLYNYVYERSGFQDEDLLIGILTKLADAVEIGDFDEIPDSDVINMSNLFVTLFKPIAPNDGETIDFNDQIVRNAAKILTHIFRCKNEGVTEHETVLYVQTYSLNLNNREHERIPDRLYIWGQGGKSTIVTKCCRTCGMELPDEFGYYRMKSVVLWGTHSSGKTSYLLSMLDMVTQGVPFINNESIKAHILTNDRWYDLFEKNIVLYRKGFAPEKTDLDKVPILNLRVGDVIYSFIDWPGEAFLREDNDNAYTVDDNSSRVNYVLDFRPIVQSASHVFFFIPPAQVDYTISMTETEDGVVFDSGSLIERLKEHLALTNKDRFKSLVVVLNKADYIIQNPEMASPEFVDFIKSDEPVESKLYDGAWHEEVLLKVDRDTRNGYFEQKNALLYNLINGLNVGHADHIQKYYIPVKPYGFPAAKFESGVANQNKNYRGSFQGIPYLIILRADGVI